MDSKDFLPHNSFGHLKLSIGMFIFSFKTYSENTCIALDYLSTFALHWFRKRIIGNAVKTGNSSRCCELFKGFN